MPQFLVVVMEIIKSRVKTNAQVNRDTRTERETAVNHIKACFHL